MSKIVSAFAAGVATLLIALGAVAVSGGATAIADGGGNPWHG